MTDEAPKTSFELAMERLRKKDADEGVREAPVTGEMKEAIAEVRRVYEARLAEREILHHSSLGRAADADAVSTLEEEYHRDRDRLVRERDHKIEEIRKGAAPAE